MTESMSSVNSVVPTMYCKGCWYILDGLESRRCPECGRSFDPSNGKTFSRLSLPESRKKCVLDSLKLLGLLAIPEAGSAYLSYYTISEIHRAAIILFLVLSNLLALSTLIVFRRRLTFAVLLLIFVFVVPYQAWLGIRLVMLRCEAERIVAYSQHVRAQTGKYPQDLSGYQFAFDSNRMHMDYKEKAWVGGFEISWYVGTPSTSHWYNPRYGWKYHPD